MIQLLAASLGQLGDEFGNVIARGEAVSDEQHSHLLIDTLGSKVILIQFAQTHFNAIRLVNRDAFGSPIIM